MGKTFLEWCNEYVESIYSLRKIEQDLKSGTNIGTKEFVEYKLKIDSYKTIKEYSEKQIMAVMDSEIKPFDYVQGMSLLMPILG